MLGAIKMLLVVVVLAGAAYAFQYISTLQRDLAISQKNSETLEDAIEMQQRVLDQQKQQFEQISALNKEIRAQQQETQNRISNLNTKFTQTASGKKRDLGEAALARPEAIQRVINAASKKAFRCIEIASGAPVSEEELAVTKLSEANRECPHIHPNLGESIGSGL